MVRWIAILLLVAMAGCMEQRAEHVWRLELEPDGPGVYVLEVPFMDHRGFGDAGDPTLEALRQNVRVAAGEATFEWLHSGTMLLIEGQGPATLEARNSFTGKVEQREAFSSWAMPTYNITRPNDGGPPMQVTWHVDFSGGDGHTCWADATLHADVPGDGPGMLEADEPSLVNRPWPVSCA